MRLITHLNHLIYFCYPRICAVCDRAGEGRSEVCDGCLDDLKKLEFASACEYCAMPIAEDGALCPHCQGKGVHPFSRIVRLGVFKDPIRHLIHQIKYHGRWTLAEFLAERLVAQKRMQGLLTQANVLVPIPLHPWRHMSRGYNQSEIIARRIHKLRGMRVSDSLIRLKHTETQTHLHSKEKRHENLRDAFGLLKPRAVRGKHVVLIDDVMTTGATLYWAARTIMEAEPASVSAAVIGVADPRGMDFEAI